MLGMITIQTNNSWFLLVTMLCFFVGTIITNWGDNGWISWIIINPDFPPNRFYKWGLVLEAFGVVGLIIYAFS